MPDRERHPWEASAKTDPDAVACVNWAWEPWTGYVGGYAKAARLILNRVHETGRSQDYLVYPLLFCLRHGVELALKQVTTYGRRLLDEPGDFSDSHNLDILWSDCRTILQKIWPDDTSALGEVAAVVAALKAIDPSSEGFRYPIGTQKSGRAPLLSPELHQIDLDRATEQVESVLTLLDGAHTGIDCYLGWKQDAEADYRQWVAEAEADARYYAAEARAEADADARYYAAP